MIGDYLSHPIVFARNLCAENSDIPSKLCSCSVPLAVTGDCLPVLLGCESWNWVVSALEVVLLFCLPAPYEKTFPDSSNRAGVSAAFL